MNPQRAMNFRGFLVFRQDRSAVRTDPVALATWTTVRQPDLAVFLGILAHASHRLHLNV